MSAKKVICDKCGIEVDETCAISCVSCCWYHICEDCYSRIYTMSNYEAIDYQCTECLYDDLEAALEGCL